MPGGAACGIGAGRVVKVQSPSFLRTEFAESDAQFSPEATGAPRWVAYVSNESGRNEVYVRPFPGPGEDVPVSTDGGTQVHWNSSGTELFYLTLDDRLMSVPVHSVVNATKFEVGAPVWLSGTNMGGTEPDTNSTKYMVTADGQSFVVNSAPAQPGASPITVILNWKPKDGR